MKKAIIIAVAVILVFSCQISADYTSNLQKGNNAYSAGSYAEALKYYKDAFIEKPSEKLGTLIVRLEELAEKKQNAISAQRTTAPATAPEKGKIHPASVLMVISDIALAGLMTYAYLDYNSAVDSYNNLLLHYDNTSYTDYNMMLAEMEKVQSKETLFVVSGCLAGAAVVYTFLDMFLFHAAFPVDAAMSFDKNGINLKMAVNRGF